MQETEAMQFEPSVKRSRNGTNKENQRAYKGKDAEFAVTPLASNSTSLKGVPVNLQARKAGLPIPRSSTGTLTTKPANKVAGRRHGDPSTSASRKLTAEKAAQLAAVRNPFSAVPSGRNGSSTPRHSSQTSKPPSTGAGPSRHHQTPGRSQIPSLGALTAAAMPCAPTQGKRSGMSTSKARLPDIDDLYATGDHADGLADGTVDDHADNAAHAPQEPYRKHVQVSKIRIQFPDDSDYSREDDESGIPRKSWIPSSLREPAKKATVFLTSDVADDEDHGSARGSSMGVMGHEQDGGTHYHFEGHDGSEDFDQRLNGSRETDEDDLADIIREDEHEGEFDDAPDVDDDEYDSDTPLSKRRHLPHRADSDPRSEYAKAARIHEHVEGKRPRIADYEADAQHILAAAICIFKSLVSTENAYPDKLTELTWAKQAWWEAADDLDIQLAPNRECIKIITAYSWHLRGEMKTAARNLVETVYGFRATGQTAIQLRNRQHAAALRKDDAFVFQQRGKTTEDHEGLYQAAIIQQMANRLYFKNKKDDGIILKNKYSPFPVVAFGLILAAVECAIDEWSSGSFTRVPFTEEQYAPVYRHHLRELRKYEAVSDDLQVVTQICRWLYEDGRIYAKAGPDETVVTRSLDAKVHAKALADFKRTGGRFDRVDADDVEDVEN